MATYYVRVTGSDAAAGTSAGAAWLTIDKAANTVAAGDTVYVGAGVYNELVTMDTSGTSGNQISYIADVTGEHTGDGGIVLISSIDTPDNIAVTRSYCWNQNGKEFITIRGFTMYATTHCIWDNSLTGNRCYDGVIVEDCALICNNNYAIWLDLNAGATPTSAGMIIRRCRMMGVTRISHENNASAHVDVDTLIENCEFFPLVPNASYGGVIFDGGATNTFSIGGVVIANCTSWIPVSAGYTFSYFKNTTHVSKIVNCKSIGSSFSVSASLGTTSAIEVYANVSFPSSATSGVTEVGLFNVKNTIADLVAGIADFTLYRFLGYSPYKPGEAMEFTGWRSGSLGYGQSAIYLPTDDIYGNPRGLGRGYWDKYYFDASDDAISDPGAAWTSETNIVDSSLTTAGTVSTVGSSSSNYTGAGGTNAPGSGGTITGVSVRLRATATSRTIGLAIYTDTAAETLLNTTVAAPTSASYTSWVALTEPSGGWTWAAVQALEFKLWLVTGGSGTLSIYGVQLAVSTSDGHSDTGAVETNARPTQNTSDVFGTGDSAEFAGAGYQDFWRPVAASSTTITVNAQYDSNYTGTKPTLKVMNIPGVADQSDTMTSAANTTEALSVTFTPTAAGWVRVRLVSSDTSASGKCFFDDLE